MDEPGPPQFQRSPQRKNGNERQVDAIAQIMRTMGPVRLALTGGVMLAMLGFFIFLLTKLGQPAQALLFSELAPSDANSIVAAVQAEGSTAEIRNNGTAVYVPSDRVHDLRIALANKGIPAGGHVGFEIFDEADSLGTTNFLQNVNRQRALEGELSRTIQAIESVHRARVHLVLPKRELFSREKQTPSASVVLKMKGSKRLNSEQTASIQHLVAAAVPGLTPGRITIIDDKGKLLSPGFEDEANFGAIAAKNEAQQRKLEVRMARTIEELLEKTVGFGNVRATVQAEMDFNRVSSKETQFDPEGQVVRSTQTIEQQSSENETDFDAVTIGQALPDGAPVGGERATAQSNENRTEETTNFVVSQKIINEVKSGGEIRRLNVAVLVNGVTGFDEEGNPTYEPRPPEEMALLESLVSTAVGYDENRGDQIDIINLRFADAPEFEEPVELIFGLGKNDLLRLAEIMVLSILGILVILLVVRPLVSRAFENIPAAQDAAGRLLADQGAAGLLGGPGAPAPAELEEEQFEELIDIDRVEGRVKASSVKKVGEIVEKHPEEALSIIRAWMYQEG